MPLPKYLWLLLLFIYCNAKEDNCPKKCSCSTRNGVDFINVKCGKIELINLDEIDLFNIASKIVHLNLSDNLLTNFQPKVQLIALQKLDLSKNKLSELKNNQFSELPSLRRLDISGNNIKTIEMLAFSNLGNLERLKLNQNLINTIQLGTFDPLLSLKQLDISNNPLTCDCSLLWLLDWSQKLSVKLVSNPKCNNPATFKNSPVRKLKIGVDIHCKTPNGGFPLIEIKPSFDQVVFEGDSLKLNCRSPSISDNFDSQSIEWTWLDSDPKLFFPDISIESHYVRSTGLIDSTLRISPLQKNHTGIWSCLLATMQGNHSKGIAVVVISNDTQYCPMTTILNNKGTYMWPRTIVNYTATIPCESINENYDVNLQKASYFCAENGQWVDLNTTMCAYISETTRIFEQFSKVNSSILESAKHFKNFTSNVSHFNDVINVVHAVDTIYNYLNYLAIEQIGVILMDVTNSLLNLPSDYLKEADRKFGISAKLVNITMKLADIAPSPYLHKNNIALEVFPIKDTGLKCTWYVDVDGTNRQFYCGLNSQTETADFNGKITEASITIPETLFGDLEEHNFYPTNKNYNILVSMFSNNKLFPMHRRDGKVDVHSAVVGARLVDISLKNLSYPIYVMLRTPPVPEPTIFTPVRWDFASGWTTEGCRFSHEYKDYVIFSCHQFGYYGLLQDISEIDTLESGAKFKLSHPAIYVGSSILILSLLVVIVTYIFCYPFIQMPKKAKHSLINTWICISFLCFFYIFGIYQTEDIKICQIVGMLLHYFTLSSLLWMCVGVNCMYKRLNKGGDIMELQVDDDLPSAEPIKKPILGLYFVGWGVGLIVCGISAAINIKEYSSPEYCFLKIGPPLSALYVPSIILLLFIAIFFMLIRCAIYNLDANGHLSEGTQATENVDLDLLEPNFPAPNNDARSVSSKTGLSEVEDPEHSPSTQLKAHIIFLVIYLITWLSCAFATVIPYHFASYEEDLFSITYAVAATILSAFTLFFYCVARNDVRVQWVNFGKFLKFRSRNISDTSQNLPPLPAININVNLNVEQIENSRSSSRSSHTKSNQSNAFKAAVDLNGSYEKGVKINNVNLIALHRQQYRTSVIPNIIENPTSAAEVFYNPHQSTVARKFFKRQKRHMMKRNNITRPRDQNSDAGSVISKKDNSSVDQRIFGTNSKVNNTNIHVEHVRKKTQNPNLFSDSAEESYEVPVENIVLNAERLRRKELTRHNRKKQNSMRSVSQQCTLEYSSENVSDSILDKSPDEKDKTKSTESASDSNAIPNAKIYVNPPHDLHKRVQSRASSVSVSDLDELYQQIRGGPKLSLVRTRHSPYLSDSDINSYSERRARNFQFSKDTLSDDVETTV